MNNKIVEEKLHFGRIFMLSDIHFGVRTNSLEWLENQLDFFYRFYIPFLKNEKKDGDLLWILGDWFDNRQLLDINVLAKSFKLVMDLSSILPVHFMVGNHDIYKKNDTDINSISIFRLIPNVKIYEFPSIVTNGKTKILIMPWIGNKNKEEEILSLCNVDYVFAHTDIEGLRYDNGQNIKTGTNFKKYKIKKIFSGHIHKRQHHNNIIYIGSPYSTKRSDIGNTKGVYLFDPKTNEEFFYSNPISPIFRRIHLDELLEMTTEQAFSELENNYTDIIVPDRHIHLFNLTRFLDILNGCKFKKIETRGEINKIEESDSEIIEGTGIKDILSLLEKNLEDLYNDDPLIIENLKSLNKYYYEKAKEFKLEQEYI